MGNLLPCFSRQEAEKRPVWRLSKAPANGGGDASRRWSRTQSARKDSNEDALIHERALAAAILLSQRGALPFDRSASVRSSGAKKQQLPRSASSRARSLADPLVRPHQLVNQDLQLDDSESGHVVLVHGGGFGAWCWYKTMALLEEGGFTVNAIDLSGSGVDSVDTNSVTSLSQYVTPLTIFLEKIEEGEKIILVGHDIGGTCISYAMESFPSKVAKAVFVCATMPTNGQSTFDVFSQQAGKNDLMQRAQRFLYAKGNSCPPTAIDLDKSLLHDLLFNQSSSKDVALAFLSMRPIPLAPVLEKLSLSDENYGSVRRFFIQTSEDNAIPLALQQSMIETNPPERVLRLKGSDHSPFFSKPQGLHRLLVEIARIPSIPVH